MKAKIENKKLIFTDYTSKEIEKVKKLLSWKGSEYVEPECLLFLDGEQFYTFWGLHDILATKVDLELFGLPEIYFDDIPEIPNDLLQGITLYDYQISAIRKGLTMRVGINEIPTSGGKTEIILGVLKILFDNNKIKKSFIVVPSISLAEQFYSRSLLRGFTPGSVGRFHGTIKEIGCPITVGVKDSLINGYRTDPWIKDLIKTADAVFFDEAHHIKASTYAELALATDNAKYLLCYSGSPFHGDDILEDPGDAVTYGLAGNIIYTISRQYLVKRGIIADLVVFFKSLPGRLNKYPGRYANIYQSNVVENDYRNNAILTYIDKFKKIEFPSLTLVKKKEHARDLLTQLKDPKAIHVSGGGKAASFNDQGYLDEYTIEYDTFVQNFESNLYNIIIATKVFNEGIDLPTVQALIMGTGEKSRIEMLQKIGRPSRKKKDSINRAYIVDFKDHAHIYLYSQYKKREKIYNNLGIRIVEDEMEFNRMLQAHKEALNGKVS